MGPGVDPVPVTPIELMRLEAEEADQAAAKCHESTTGAMTRRAEHLGRAAGLRRALELLGA